jgi:polyphosphate kinase
MDEFFMKRVGGLKQQMDAGVTELTPDGRTPVEQWEAILEESRTLFSRQAACYEDVRASLAEEGVHIVDWESLSAHEQASLSDYFEQSVLPTLTPSRSSRTSRSPWPFSPPTATTAR